MKVPWTISGTVHSGVEEPCTVLRIPTTPYSGLVLDPTRDVGRTGPSAGPAVRADPLDPQFSASFRCSEIIPECSN